MIILIQIIKWMPPYWYNKPPYTYPNPTRYFIFNFLIISFIFIENKCLYDVIRHLKREKKKVRQKSGSNPGRSRSHDTWFIIWATGADVSADSAVLLLVLYTWIDRCLVQSAVSNLFPNQWCCLKLYLPLPVCLICRCVFWLILFFRFAFAFVIYFCFQNRDLFCTSRSPYSWKFNVKLLQNKYFILIAINHD